MHPYNYDNDEDSKNSHYLILFAFSLLRLWLRVVDFTTDPKATVSFSPAISET